MAFADTIVANTDAEVVLVDRRHRPGGHWLDAYPFVRLHQPGANAFDVRLQHSQLRYVTTSLTQATTLAENYVGLDVVRGRTARHHRDHTARRSPHRAPRVSVQKPLRSEGNHARGMGSQPLFTSGKNGLNKTG